MNRIVLREKTAREEQRRDHVVKTWKERERERERKSGDGPAENVIWQPCQSESWPASDEPHIEHTNAKLGPLR